MSTFIVMGSTLVSRLFGFVRIAVVGAIYGAGGEADVLNAVFTIPNNLRKLMAEGALSSAFIPVLSRSLVQDPGGERSRKIVGNIFTFQLLIIVPLLIGSVLFAPRLVRLILDFPDPERILLSTRLFRWMIHYLLLVSVSAVMMGVINAHSGFFIPAVTPILFSVAVISSILLFHDHLGAFAMVVGVLVGGVVQILFQLPTLLRYGYSLGLDFRFRNPDFIHVMKQWLPVVATASVYTINEQIAIRFSTALEVGSASAMSNALVFWQLPFGIFSASITTVLFPRMSRQAGLEDLQGLKATLEYGFQYLILLLVPSAIFLSLLGEEVIAVALQRGIFTAENTLITARVLRGFNWGLLPVGAFNFFQRYFYSRDDFRTPLHSAVFVCITDIALSLWLKETPLRVTGLAVANSLAFAGGLVIMYHQASRSLGGLDGKKILMTFGKTLVSAAPAAVFLRAYLLYTGDWWRAGSTGRNLGLLAAAGLGALGILGVMFRLVGMEVLSVFRKKEARE